jgi:MFS-type transporter involved in bile tolerance (Atg22 family)
MVVQVAIMILVATSCDVTCQRQRKLRMFLVEYVVVLLRQILWEAPSATRWYRFLADVCF